MIRLCTAADREAIYEIVNDAARAYQGVIPQDCWHEPYMSMEALRREIDDGVVFWGYDVNGELSGVMGIQDKGDVALVRHAYVRTACRRQGIGTVLLSLLKAKARTPLLVGTWAAASWAVAFYCKHGFRLTTRAQTDRLLTAYWRIPPRQVETSVVLADTAWFERQEEAGAS
ncbi:MAG: GNAT family N-acetyltransferase [Chitinivibrionales bacterium]|nr:GNAT family N-acetyltransferase [Chitinivibrionales bacterium]